MAPPQTGQRRQARARAHRRGPRLRKRPLIILALTLIAALALRLTVFKATTDPVTTFIEEELTPAPTPISMAVSPDDVLANPYDWSRLSHPGYFHEYRVNGTVASRVGVDVSEFQGAIDWPTVHDMGVDFAYVRVGYRGSTTPDIVADSRAEQNMDGVLDVGMSLGVYFFSQATTEDEAIEEADYVIDHIGGRQLTYPVAFDLEPESTNDSRVSDLTNDQRTAVTVAFCERIRERGYNAVVYGNQYDLGRMDLARLAPYGFWYAEYESAPTSQIAFGIWQYSRSGMIDGIGTKVDVDLDLTGALRQTVPDPTAHTSDAA